MDPPPFSETTIQFLQWYQIQTTQVKVLVHQLLDSLQWHWKLHGTKPSLDVFNLPQDLHGVKATIVVDWFLQLHDADIDSSLASLSCAFPQGYRRLPVLRPREPLEIVPAQTIAETIPRADAPSPSALPAAILPSSPAVQHPIPNIEALLRDKNHIYTPMFRDLAHLRQTKSLYQQYNDNKEDRNAKHRTNVPNAALASSDWATRVTKVGEIFTALVDLSDIHDKGKKVLDPLLNVEVAVKEKNTAVRRVINSSDLELQLLAWDIFLFSEEAQNGRVGIPPWVERWGYETFNTHEERLTLIKNGLKNHKSIVNAFFSANAVRRFVAAPRAEIKAKGANQVLNDDRANFKVQARQAVAALNGIQGTVGAGGQQATQGGPPPLAPQALGHQFPRPYPLPPAPAFPMDPHQSGFYQGSSHQTAPHHMANNKGPRQTIPRQTGPRQTDPSQIDPRLTDPHQTIPRQTGPRQTDPTQIDPRLTDPHQTGPKPAVSEDEDRPDKRQRRH